MLPSEVMIPAFQRMEEVMEDLDALDWELSQIALHPDLPIQLVSEAEENIAQARRVVQQVVLQVQTIMTPWASELAALKAAQEAVLHTFWEERVEKRAQASPCCPHQEVSGQQTAHRQGTHDSQSEQPADIHPG